MSISDKLITIAENEQKVYNAGKKSQYDVFWDNFQDKGNRTEYFGAFMTRDYNNKNYNYWNAETFKPKYSMCPVGNATYMFSNIDVGDFKQLLNDLGIVLDTSKVTHYKEAFLGTKIKNIGTLDLSKCFHLHHLFQDSDIENVDKIILRNDGDVVLYQSFLNASELENITFEGCIGNSDIDFQWSPKLTKKSIVSVINALSSTKGFVATFSKVAIVNAFGNVKNEEWLSLLETKQNWVITLV